MKVLKATWQKMGAADSGGVQERNKCHSRR